MSKFDKLSARKQKYTFLLAQGNTTKKDALLKAGYSENTARNPHIVETEDVKAAFRELVRKKIPASKIIKRIAQGMDAVSTQFFQKDGVVTDSRDVILWNERRQSAELAAQLGGYWSPKHEIEQTQRIDERTLSRFADIAERLQVTSIGIEQRKALAASHKPLIEASDCDISEPATTSNSGSRESTPKE